MRISDHNFAFAKGFLESLAYLLPIQVMGVVGLYVKHVQLNLSSGFLVISRFIGKSNVADLSLVERLAFYREDLIINFAVIPIVVVFLLRALPGRSRPYVALAIGAFLGGIFFVGLQGLGNVGRFLTLEMLSSAFLWGAFNPQSIKDYIDPTGLIKLLVVIGVCATLIIAANRIQRLRLPLGMASGILVVTSAAFFGLLFRGEFSDFPQSRSVIRSMNSALFTANKFSVALDSVSKNHLAVQYNETVGINPQIVPHSEYFGSASDSDVIIFLMETAPMRSNVAAHRLDKSANLSRLEKYSFTNAKHYSTYPYTSDAIFSLLTSLYPTARDDYLSLNSTIHEFGLLASLVAEGYESAVYAPSTTSFENDIHLFDVLGANSQYVAAKVPFREEFIKRRTWREITEMNDKSTLTSNMKIMLELSISRDLMALEKMKSDIVRFRREGKRFAAIFLPQIGHGPWPNYASHSDVVDQGAEIILMQHRWLDEIVQLLEENGGLNDSIILLTSDHGVRTRTEDPAFDAGKISDYSFNVPFLLFAPKAIRSLQQIDQLTSHIDVAPTIAALLGISLSGPPPQGLPMWDERIDHRVTFFLARDYLGSDGFYEKPHFFMYEALTDQAYRNTSMDFDIENIVDPESRDEIRERVNTLYGISNSWSRLAPKRTSKYARNPISE